MTLRRITAPAEQPVSLAEMKVHSRVEDDEDDALIQTLIGAAVLHVEQITGRRLVAQQWEKRLDAFPANGGAIELRLPPVISVDEVAYFDEQSIHFGVDPSAYELDAQSQTAWLVPAYGYVWPQSQEKINSATVKFTTGYGAAADVPDDFKVVIKLLAAHWYENREAVNVGSSVTPFDFAVNALLAPHIVMAFV